MPLLFRLKKLLSRLVLTFTLPWLCLILAVIVVPEYLNWIVPTWLLIMLLASNLGSYLLARLANRFPQFDPQSLPPGQKYLIAVAGSGYQHHPNRSPETWFSDELSTRMSEAGRIAHLMDHLHLDYRLMVSIPEHPDQNDLKLQALAAFFQSYDVPADRISILDHVLDSEDEIEAFQHLNLPIIMVSSCWHVPRFITMANYLNCQIYPAPAGYYYQSRHRLIPLPSLPTASGLCDLECVLHELAGTLVFQVKVFLKHITKH